MKKNRINYFDNLDALRFFAFFMVFLRHYFDFSFYQPSSEVETFLLEKFTMNGRLGVNLFFVLSGFLITYLLLKEIENTGTINIRFFYYRRILRIWPLYILIVALHFFIIPLLTNQFSIVDIKEHIIYYCLFLNNFDILNTGFVGIDNDGLSILWSIAVEEQFYLIWPVLFTIINKKYYNYLFLAVIIFSLVFRVVYVSNKYVIYFHTLSVMSDLAVGGILAYNFIYGNKFMQYLQKIKKGSIAIVYIFIFIAIIFHAEWSQLNNATKVLERLVMSFLFSFVIAEQCFSNNSIFKLGSLKAVSKLGVISYGLYCLHLLSISVVQKLNSIFHINQANSFVFYSELFVSLLLTVILSYLSYNYFEKLFLKFKHNYSTI